MSSTAVLFLIAVGLGLRSSHLSIIGMGLGSIFLLLSIVVTSAVVIILWWGIQKIHVEYQWIPSGDTYNSAIYNELCADLYCHNLLDLCFNPSKNQHAKLSGWVVGLVDDFNDIDQYLFARGKLSLYMAAYVQQHLHDAARRVQGSEAGCRATPGCAHALGDARDRSADPDQIPLVCFPLLTPVRRSHGHGGAPVWFTYPPFPPLDHAKQMAAAKYGSLGQHWFYDRGQFNRWF